MTLDEVDALATSFPGVTVGTRWGNRTWLVGDQGFAWERPFSKADLKRFGDEVPPAGAIVALRCANLDAKDALLALGLPGFFTIEHFTGYAAVLVALKQARAKDIRAALRDAFATQALGTPVRAKQRSRRRRSP